MKINSITSIFSITLFFLLILNTSFANTDCYNCSSLSGIIRVTDFVPTVSDENIILDFNISCKVPSNWGDRNIFVNSVVVKKNDLVINPTSFDPIINCIDQNYQRQIKINECSESVYSVSFDYNINEPGCVGGNCKGLTKFVAIKSCNPNKTTQTIPDNNFVPLVFVFTFVLFVLLKNKKK
ncbi:MAG: hypothetical protein GX950_03330 [Candidatus Diapherotrites archaeon]|uniref:Uncharacterized protein n=1 Tax=Candidatus Iainarchaeum sp. TaxID=3101447 RepID=A0A7K4BZZ1_9ARCH|nr:hypothetical protein [Candidatus Diapherotrites archaeon]